MLLALPLFVEYAIYNDMVEVTLISFLTGQAKAKTLTTVFQTLIFSILWASQWQQGGAGLHVSSQEFLAHRAARAREVSLAALELEQGTEVSTAGAALGCTDAEVAGATAWATDCDGAVGAGPPPGE